MLLVAGSDWRHPDIDHRQNSATIFCGATADSQTYSVSADTMRGTEPVNYTYRTVISATGNRLRLRVDQPTRGLTVDMDYTDTAMTDMNVLDYITSSERTQITRTPADVPGKSIGVQFDGWVFPRSGMAFVWSEAHSTRAAKAGLTTDRSGDGSSSR